ncbi:Mu transposase domain-containing protein, partial [Peptoniphilus indolicus]
KINNRVNLDIHQGTGQIPIKLLEKEKDFLKPLPSKQIRNLYKIKLTQVRVNKSSMITYKKNQYSVPTEYENKPLNLQVLDNKLYVYDNTKLVTIHKISHKKLNYHLEDYEEILSNTLKNKDSVAIKEIAKENLKKIGEIYGI